MKSMNKMSKIQSVGVLTGIVIGLLHFSLVFADEFHYDSHGKRDPFLAPGVTSSGSVVGRGEIQLQGIVIDEKNGSYAIVNGEIAKEGELFQGFSVKKITPNKVHFEAEGESFEAVL